MQSACSFVFLEKFSVGLWREHIRMFAATRWLGACGRELFGVECTHSLHTLYCTCVRGICGGMVAWYGVVCLVFPLLSRVQGARRVPLAPLPRL